jgi:hypothetical protein
VPLEKRKQILEICFYFPIEPGPPTRRNPLGSATARLQDPPGSRYRRPSLIPHRTAARVRLFTRISAAPCCIAPGHPRALVHCSTHKPACARLSTSASPVACAALGRLCHCCATPLVSRRCVLPEKPVLTSLLPHLTDPLAQLVPASTAACLAQSLASPATMVDPACGPKPPLAVLTKP